ncbi:MAG: lipid II flippase MurJ [Desulfovibrionaceae bacterium]
MVFRVWGHPWDIQFLVQGTLAGSVLIANSNLLVDQSMATQLSAGGLSTLRYAYRINDLPLQLIVLALSKAILPFVSEQVCDGDSSGLRRIFAQSLASLGLIAFPVIALVMLFAGDIVVVLLRRGAFDAEAARHTVLALRCYTGGLFFFPYACNNGAFFCACAGPMPCSSWVSCPWDSTSASTGCFCALWGGRKPLPCLPASRPPCSPRPFCSNCAVLWD